ncbi:MAG: nucleotide-binding protein [Polyangiaceae bacterium]|nr:nucleotide-binding protein [Polyangiaceae bacterium]
MNRSTLVLAPALAGVLGLACDKRAEPPPTAETPAAASAPLPADDPRPAENAAPTEVSGVVTEKLSLPSYTYLLLDTGSEKVWTAVPAATVDVGARVTVRQAILMRGYRSTALNRDFDRVYFGTLAADGVAAHGGAAPAQSHPQPAPSAPVAADVRAAKSSAPDGKTVAECIGSAAKLAGKIVSVRGVVVKSNPNIMGKTWLHLQDGTGSAADRTNDLTVTVPEQHRPAVGQTVVVRGPIATDKDLGGGYKFAVLLEGTELVVEPAKR